MGKRSFSNRSSAFVSNSLIRPVQPSNQNLKPIGNKLKYKSNNGLDFNNQVAEVIITEVLPIVKAYATSRILNTFKGELKPVPTDIFSGDGSGLSKMASQFKSSPSAAYNMKTDVISVKEHKYEIVINEKAKGIFANTPHHYEKQERTVFNSKIDNITMKGLYSLISEAGFNQSLIDFLDIQTFISIDYLMGFCDMERKISEQARIERNNLLRSITRPKKDENGNFKPNGARQLLPYSQVKNQLANRIKRRLYSKILYTKTRLTIESDVPSYATKLTIHLCSWRNYMKGDKKLKVPTIEEFFIDTVKDIRDIESRSIRRRELISLDVNPKNFQKGFKRSMLVQPGTNIWKVETLRDNVNIVKSFKYILKPSEKAILDLTVNFPRGVDLYDLNRCQRSDGTCNYFFIVEAEGQRNARVTNNRHQDIKHTGFGIIKLRYNCQTKIAYIAHEKNLDIPDTCTIEQGKDLNFQDGMNAMEFHEDRVSTLNIDYRKLNVNGNLPKAEYSLDLDARTLINGTILDRIQLSENNVFIDFDDAQQFEKEMIVADKQLNANFENTNVFDKEETDIENFDKNINDLFLELDPNDNEPTGFAGNISNRTINNFIDEDF